MWAEYSEDIYEWFMTKESKDEIKESGELSYIYGPRMIVFTFGIRGCGLL